MAELFLRKTTKEPIEVNLVDNDHAEAIAIWCGGVYVLERDAFKHEDTFGAVNVPTASGMKRASEGAWVIRLETGNFDVLTPSEFSEQFTSVRDIRRG